MDKLAEQMTLVLSKAGGNVKFTAEVDEWGEVLTLTVVVFVKAPVICTNWVTLCNYSQVFSACKLAARQCDELSAGSGLRVRTVMCAYGRLLKRANSDLGRVFVEVLRIS